MQLHSARLTLRPMRRSDADAVHAYLGDPAVVAYLTYPALSAAEVATRLTGVEAAWASWVAAPDERFNLTFAVTLGGTVVGEAHAWNVQKDPWSGSPDPTEVWIGYTIHPGHQGRGYATEAVRALVDWLFSRGTRRIHANLYSDNRGSQRLLERLGFVVTESLSAEEDDSGKNLASCAMLLEAPAAPSP